MDLPTPAPTFLERLAAPTPTPGGGAAAAEVLALAVALAEMAVGLGQRRRPSEAGGALLEDLARLRQEAIALREADEAAFGRVMEAFRRSRREGPTGPPAEALLGAAEPPLAVCRLAVAFLQRGPQAQSLALATARSDLEAAGRLAEAAARVALLNVQANLDALAGHPARTSLAARMAQALHELERQVSGEAQPPA